MVALIGRDWLNAADASGRRRLDRSDDFVRTEIAKALASRVRVIPALVGDAVMPEAKDLPKDLQGLTRRQAIEISDTVPPGCRSPDSGAHRHPCGSARSRGAVARATRRASASQPCSGPSKPDSAPRFTLCG